MDTWAVNESVPAKNKKRRAILIWLICCEIYSYLFTIQQYLIYLSVRSLLKLFSETGEFAQVENHKYCPTKFASSLRIFYYYTLIQQNNAHEKNW